MHQVLHAGQSLQIKGGGFDLATFLRDDLLLAEHYAGGAAVIVRLYLSDYHRCHSRPKSAPLAAVRWSLSSIQPFAGAIARWIRKARK